MWSTDIASTTVWHVEREQPTCCLFNDHCQTPPHLDACMQSKSSGRRQSPLPKTHRSPDCSNVQESTDFHACRSSGAYLLQFHWAAVAASTASSISKCFRAFESDSVVSTGENASRGTPLCMRDKIAQSCWSSRTQYTYRNATYTEQIEKKVISGLYCYMASLRRRGITRSRHSSPKKNIHQGNVGTASYHPK